MIRVLIVEDSKITREALESQISQSERYVLKASIENAANAEIVCMGGNVDLILMDVCTAYDESGLKTAREIKEHYPFIKIVIMTSMPEYSFINKAKSYGCDGFWYKEDENLDIVSVCDRVIEGESVWPERTPSIQVGNVSSDEFTERELDVLRALAQGYSYKEISEMLYISNNTLKYHIRNLLQKTGYRSTLQLVVDAVDRKLILPRY